MKGDVSMFGSEKKKAPFRKSRGNMAFAYPSSGAFFAWTGIARTALCIVSLSGVLFGAALVVDATVKKRNAPDERPMISEGYAAGCPSIGSELPPAMFNPSSRWTEGDMFLASATGERFDSPLVVDGNDGVGRSVENTAQCLFACSNRRFGDVLGFGILVDTHRAARPTPSGADCQHIQGNGACAVYFRL